MAAAICGWASGRATATTAGPDNSLPAAASTATGVMATRGKAGVGGGTRCATPLTAPASTKEVIAATLNAEFGVIRIPRWRIAAGWRWLNIRMPKSVRDLRTTAGSSACALRRWRAIYLIPALGGDRCGVGVLVAVPAGLAVVVADGSHLASCASSAWVPPTSFLSASPVRLTVSGTRVSTVCQSAVNIQTRPTFKRLRTDRRSRLPAR